MAGLFSNVISSIVYFSLRSAQTEFFRWIHIEGQPLNDPRRHLLVVANHPYGVQDAFLLTTVYTRPFYFCATALNFQRREGDVIRRRRLRGWLMTNCRVLPIVRNRNEGHVSENYETFRRAAEHIAEGYALGIFAEGDSHGNQWSLLKLKAGAAQIALQVAGPLAERGARLQVQVVGLNYTNWKHPFKSTVTLRFAEPFQVEPVDLDDTQAVRQARREITDRLTEVMQELTVHVPREHHELVGKVARFYSFEGPNDHVRLALVAEKVSALADRFADQRPELEAKLDEYLALADELRIYPGDERRAKDWWLLPVAPLAWLGLAVSWPIVKVPGWVVHQGNTEMHAIGSDRVMWGIVTTFVWYLILAVASLGLGIWWLGWWGLPLGLGVLVACASLGMVASRTLRRANMVWRSLLPSRRRFRRYRQLGRELYRRFEQLRHADQAGGEDEQEERQPSFAQLRTKADEHR